MMLNANQSTNSCTQSKSSFVLIVFHSVGSFKRTHCLLGANCPGGLDDARTRQTIILTNNHPECADIMCIIPPTADFIAFWTVVCIYIFISKHHWIAQKSKSLNGSCCRGNFQRLGNAFYSESTHFWVVSQAVWFFSITERTLTA